MRSIPRYLLLALILIVCRPLSLSAQFENATVGTRSQAMGAAFVALADDASALFLNPAGLVLATGVTVYGDYSEPPGEKRISEAKADAVLPVGGTVFGAGWYRSGFEDGTVENQFVAGVARRIVEGTQGSFLSVGASVRVGRISYDRECDCRDGRGAVSEATGDLGIIIRPLPVISFGYAIESIRETVFDIRGDEFTWHRKSRWGFSYFWEKRLAVSFEQEHLPGRLRRHYGFVLRTSVPLELLAGFSDEEVSGGARWMNDRFRASVAFASGGEAGLTTRLGIELLLWGRKGTDAKR